MGELKTGRLFLLAAGIGIALLLLWIRTPNTMPGLLQQVHSALLVVCGFLFEFCLFVLPGFSVACLATAYRHQVRAVQLIGLVLATGTTLGYISFWAFFFSKLLGKVFCIAVYTASAAVVVALVRTHKGHIKKTVALAGAPFMYAAMAGTLYLCFLFLFTNPAVSGAGYAGQRFFDQVRPGDNLIPLILAAKIYRHEPIRPFCCGDWLSSDRPPLEAGVLLERPIHVIHNSLLEYELLTVGLECLWICGVCQFFCRLGLVASLHGRRFQSVRRP